MYDLIIHSHLLSSPRRIESSAAYFLLAVTHTHFSVKNLSKHGRVFKKKYFIRERICRIVQFSTNRVASRSPSCQFAVNCLKFECYFFLSVGR